MQIKREVLVCGCCGMQNTPYTRQHHTWWCDWANGVIR